MKSPENSQSENITTIEESNILKNVLSQQNIFPMIKNYTSIINSQINKTSKINTSVNNSKLYTHNKSSNDLNTKYHNSELFPFPQKKNTPQAHRTFPMSSCNVLRLYYTDNFRNQKQET